MSVVLAFDFGLRYIGVAVGQAITQTARGIATLECPPAKPGIPRWRELTKLTNDHQPKLMVVGLPLNMDDSEADITARARNFASQLQKRFDLPVELHDERLTTREASDPQVLADARALGRARSDHELAACLILESWFNAGQKTT
ncbi:MAG: Holliday junction resolvase RuvX [Pseudomonadales bacterium]